MKAPVEYLTLMRATTAGRRAFRIKDQIIMTKVFERSDNGAWKEKSSAANAYLNHAQMYPVNDVKDLLSYLQKGSAFPSCYAIRGHLVSLEREAKNIRRLVYDDPKGDKATISLAPTKIFFWDGDSFALPEIIDPMDIPAVVEHAMTLMPPCLQQSSCVWQVTSGHGIKPGGRLRFAFIADVPVSPEDLKLLFKDCPGTDTSVFSPSQPIYIAAPIFIDGEDFIPQRLGIREAAHDFAPIAEFLREAKRDVRNSNRPISWGLKPDVRKFDAEIGDPPAYPSGKGFFRPTQKAIARYIGKHGPDCDVDTFLSSLSKVVEERGRNSGRSTNYIQNRLRDMPKFANFLIEKEHKSREVSAPEGYQRPSQSVEEASASMHLSIQNFFKKAETDLIARQRNFASVRGAIDVQPETLYNMTPIGEVALIRSELGLGKTEIAINFILKLINGEFQGAEPFDAPLISRRVEYLVNDHKLADELAARFNEKRPGTACVWKGMEQPSREGGGTMCRRISDMRLWLDAGGKAGKMCKYCTHGPTKEDDCEYLNQISDLPVLISATPQGPTSKIARGIFRNLKANGMAYSAKYGPDLIVIDETRAPSWLGGFDDKPYFIDVKTFAGQLRHADIKVNWSTEDWWYWDERIDKLRATMLASLGKLKHGEEGSITFGELRKVLPDCDSWLLFRKHAYALLLELDEEHSKLSGPDLARAIADYGSWNGKLFKIAQLCFVVAQALEALTEDFQKLEDDQACHLIKVINGRAPGTGLMLRWRMPIVKGRQDKPTLILDGTAEPRILYEWFPLLQVISDERVALPQQGLMIVQTFDSISSYTGWVPRPLAQDASVSARQKHATAVNNVRKLAWAIECLAPVAGEAGIGLIGPKGLNAELANVWSEEPSHKPSNLLLGHFNNIAGLDSMKDVRILMIWSRPSPPPATVEDMASVIFNRPMPRIDAWYEGGKGTYIRRDGSFWRAEKSETHPDPRVELVRAQIVDAEILQAIARSRYIRRDASKPLLVIVGTSLPTKLEIDKLVRRKEVLCVGPIETLASRGVVVSQGPDNKGYAQVLSSAVGWSVQAIKDHLRNLNVENPYNVSPLGNFHVELDLPAPKYTEFEIKLTLGARYWTKVKLRNDLAGNPEAALAAEGVQIASIRRLGVDGAMPFSAQPLHTVTVAELPYDKQSEIPRALGIFHAHGELQMVADTGSSLQAKADSIALMPLWTDAINLGWDPEDLYASPTAGAVGGLVYWMNGEAIASIDRGCAVSQSGRIYERLAA